MTTQSGFTPEEWNLLRMVPSFATSGVSIADPSGIYGSIKEAAAGMQGMIDSLEQGSNIELLGAMLADRSVPEMPAEKTLLGEGNRERRLSGFRRGSGEQRRTVLPG